MIAPSPSPRPAFCHSCSRRGSGFSGNCVGVDTSAAPRLRHHGPSTTEHVHEPPTGPGSALGGGAGRSPSVSRSVLHLNVVVSGYADRFIFSRG